MNVPRPCCDASRMAYLYAMRRDWSPRTAPWNPFTAEALFMTALEIDAEAQAALDPNPFEEPS